MWDDVKEHKLFYFVVAFVIVMGTVVGIWNAATMEMQVSRDPPNRFDSADQTKVRRLETDIHQLEKRFLELQKMVAAIAERTEYLKIQHDVLARKQGRERAPHPTTWPTIEAPPHKREP